MNLNTNELNDLTEHDLKHLYDMYARSNGYNETPPTIDQFISDPYYLGDSLHFGKAVFPYWRERLVEIYPTPFYETNKYKVIVLSGATGIGKSTVSSIIFLYDLCRILCLDEPQKRFRLPKSAKIFFTLTNSTLENVEQVNYDPIISFIRQSPFFRSKFNNAKSKTSLFINNIDINMVSRKHSLVGKNVYSASSDEINQEVTKGGSQNIVTEMYNRINSRFLQPGNKWPGTYTLISSATTESSLIQTIMDNANDKEDDSFNKKDILVISAPRFEILRHKIAYSGQTFKIFIGDYQSDPFIINTEEELKRAKMLDETKVFDVPIEHLGEFENEIYAGIRDVLGMAVSDVRTFMPFKDRIRNSLSLSRLCELDEIILDEDSKLIEFFNRDVIDSFKPGSQKVIGLDIAVSGDRFGLCMLHIHDTIGQGDMAEQVYWVDFAVGIKPPKGKQLQLWQIREFIVELVNMGIGINYVVSDSYQSTDTLQLLNKQGIEAVMNSVDRKKDPYHIMRSAIMEGRLFMPYNKILYKELVFLKENEKKIDHPDFFPDGTVGSKDIADAVCNALFIAQSKLEYIPYVDNGFIEELNRIVDEDESEWGESLFGEGTRGVFHDGYL